MYLPFEHFVEVARDLLKPYNISVKKQTNGIDKGKYSATIKLPIKENESSRDYLISVFGTNIPTWTKFSRITQEESKEQMISDVGLALFKHNRSVTKQYFSDIYEYWKKEIPKKNIYTKGKIGYNACVFFDLITGTINEENYLRKRVDYPHDIQKKINTVNSFKEFYYLIKQLTKEEWLDNNRQYTDRYQSWEKDYLKVNTFTFDEEKIQEIENIENYLENPTPKVLNSGITEEIVVDNKGFVKIGYRKDFLNYPILYGRERNIILANGEKHKAIFAIVELDQILASHNEFNFSPTENYPTNEDGRNINDRNYSGDINAQAKVIAVSQNLEPEIIISTSATASGTPIISTDGIVVSGNNRTMSLKLANKQHKGSWENYLKTLQLELDYEGYGFSNKGLGVSLVLKEKISLPGSSFNNPLSVTFENPILVRIDYAFGSYTTDEMAKYNKTRSKSERPIDVSIKMAQQLKDNENCLESLLSLISEQEIVSDLYNDVASVKKFKKILIDCNLITENDVSSIFLGNGLTDAGKTFYSTLLLSLVLKPGVLEISQNAGIKSIISNVVNAIIDINKNKFLESGKIIDQINQAIYIQSEINSTNSKNVKDFIREGNLFEKSHALNPKSTIINYWLNQKANDFKKLLRKYNEAIADSMLPNIFGENMTAEQIFKMVFEDSIPEDLKQTIALVFNNDEKEDMLPIVEEIIEPEIIQPETIDNKEINIIFDKKIEIQNQIKALKTASKYNPNEESEKLIKALELTLKYT